MLAGLTRAGLALVCLFCLSAATEVRAQSSSTPIRWSDVQLLSGRTLPAGSLNGKVVVVQFWASWCPFCARQNPYLQRLHERHGRELQVLAFSIDAKPDDALRYLKEHGYTFSAAIASSQSAEWFPDRKGLPVVYVVDRTGRIVFHEAGEMFEEDIATLARFATR